MLPEHRRRRLVIRCAVVTSRTASTLAPAAAGDGAGASARREAQRRRDQAERLLRDAEWWEQGALGEERTAAALAWLPPGHVTLHDLAVPGSRATIDHLVIGPTGVFVIDTDVHAGTVRYGSGTLWCDRHAMRRELQALAFEATRVSAVLDAPVVPLMCFTDGQLPRRELTLDGVRVLSLAALLPYVTDRAARTLPHEVERLAQEAKRLTRAVRRTAPRASADEAEPEPGAPAVPPVGAAVVATIVAAPEPASRRASRVLPLASSLAVTGLLAFGIGSVVRHRAGATTTEIGGSSGAASIARAVAAPKATAGATTAASSPGERLVVTALVTCPAAGQGWTITPVWPGLTAGAVRYEVSWRPTGSPTWIAARLWSSAQQAPPAVLEHVTSGASIELRLVAQDAAHRALTDDVATARAPDSTC